MGFYGNITNTNRTQFQFDKTFPNRKVMDDFTKTDGVYIGRYVLVEYDNQLAADWCTIAYQKTINGVKQFFSAPMASDGTPQINSKYQFGAGNIVTGKYIRVPGYIIDTDSKKIIYNLDSPGEESDTIYHIDGPLVDDLNDKEKDIKVTLISQLKDSPYNENYNIDIKAYGPGRGYDSTVWQKVYADGNEKYVMIAELNSVVPTFGISPDAPTLSPVAPHFDADSTNIYYKVHWQPNWGFRVKSASPNISSKPINDKGETTSGENVTLSNIALKKIPSDEDTIWTRAAYDYSTGKVNKYYFKPQTEKDKLNIIGEWERSDEAPSGDISKIPAAIYYNKAGFNPSIISYSDEDIVDKISLEATGLSGYKYNKHDGTGGTEPQIDTQELSILLPSIGNSVAKMWDIIYGDEKINNSNKRNLHVSWSEGSILPDTSGLRLVTKNKNGYGYSPNQANTLAGAINSAHDIMGMIIQEKNVTDDIEDLDVSNWNENYIYYIPSKEKFYRKYKTYKFNKYTPSVTADDEGNQDLSGYNPYESITVKKWDPTKRYYLDKVPSNPIKSNGDFYPNYILEPNSNYVEGKQYYERVILENGIHSSKLGNSFEANKYYIPSEKEMIFPGEKNPITLKSYIISPDKTYNKDSDYRIITHKSLGDVRFWERDVYYTTNFTPIDIKEVTQEKIDEGFLFVLNSKTGRYTRAKGALNTEENYYKPGNFINNDVNYDPKKTYFELNKVIENNIIYVQVIDYISVGKINEIEFNYRPYYVFINNIYYEAEEYEENTTYYIKKVTLKQYEDTGVITASDLNEVTLIDFNSTPGCCQYIPKGSGETGEYIVITAQTAKYFKDNIVQITVTNELEIYIPNFYYYLIEDNGDPLKGSVVFDNNPIKSEDRIYYKKDNVRVEGLVDYNKTKPYKPSEYYYEVNGEYILDTSLEPTPDRHYYLKNGLYVMSDATGLFPVGSEWNINVPKPSTITLGTRTNIWRLQELKGFARHYNTVHGLVLRLNNILEDNNSLTRDLSNIQGIINKVRDLFVKFDEMRPNEILVTNKLGRITTTGLKGDNWINTEYSNGSEITITHKYKGENSGKGKHEVSGESSNVTLNFGGTFTSPSFSFTTDDMGHVNKFSTSNVDITMPTLEFTEGETEANVVTNMTMSAGSGFNKITFTENRAYVGTLALNGYSKNSADDDVTEITSTDTINSAFTKINKAFNDLDYSKVSATKNKYVSTVTQTNGKISVSTADTTTITKLGKIEVGTWNANTIAVKYGGTGTTTFNAGEVLIGNGESAINTRAITNNENINTTLIANTNLITANTLYYYTGNSNINTLGTINTGIWKGTTIGVEYGGTGTTTFNNGEVLIGKGTESITTRAITDNTSVETILEASTNLITANTLFNYTGNSNITTVGTISSGIWQGTPLGTPYIADGSIITDKIVDEAITNNKVALGINGSKISMENYESTYNSTINNEKDKIDTLFDAIRKLEERIFELENPTT